MSLNFGIFVHDIKVCRTTLDLSELIGGHRQEVRRIALENEAEPLDPARCRYLPIVRRVSSHADPEGRKFAIVDGFHRLAGMLGHGTQRFPVIVVSASATLLRTIDADSVIGDHPALDRIYAARNRKCVAGKDV